MKLLYRLRDLGTAVEPPDSAAPQTLPSIARDDFLDPVDAREFEPVLSPESYVVFPAELLASITD